MSATEVILFLIILSEVYQHNPGRHILSTMYREVCGLCVQTLARRTRAIRRGLIWLAIAAMVQLLLPVVRTALSRQGASLIVSRIRCLSHWILMLGPQGPVRS